GRAPRRRAGRWGRGCPQRGPAPRRRLAQTGGRAADRVSRRSGAGGPPHRPGRLAGLAGRAPDAADDPAPGRISARRRNPGRPRPRRRAPARLRRPGGRRVPARGMKALPQTAAVLGGGAVGQVLIAALTKAGIRVVLAWNRSEQRGWQSDLDQLQEAELVFLAVSDAAVEPLCRRIAGLLRRGQLVAPRAGALLSRAMQLFQDATGAPEPIARAALLPLARGALDALEQRTAADALTGPVARGDVETVRAHRTALEAASLPLYDELARAMLE